MEIPKKHIGLFVALAIAVAVFIADRASPSGSPTGPQSADAAEVDAPNDEIKAQESCPIDDRQTRAAAVRTTLADRLNSAARSHHLQPSRVKDAFAPSPEWVGPKEGKVVIAEVAPEVDSVEVKIRQFVKAHQLKGAIVASGRSIAIIDGNCISIGQQVDGFELKSVTADTAVLVCDGAEVVLRLDTLN